MDSIKKIYKDNKDIELWKKAAENTVKKVKRGAKKLTKSIREDVAAVRERDPAARSDAEVLLLYSGVHALIAHRVAHGLHKNGHYFSARAISQFAKMITGIEIHPGATIGKGLVIDHGMGIVIGETAEIGDDCTIYQGVTLGGTGKDLGKRHPTIGNNVLLGAGAKVLGPIVIEDNSKVAANAVVLKNISKNSTAVGIPAKVVRQKGMKVDDLDQIHIPDPVAQEISRLEKKLAALSEEIAALKAEKQTKESSDENGRSE
jgi:serine O-acetyltransferase